jgi:hypothetical protein
MQKIQILFPDPVMDRLRAVARHQDRPVSELVRRAVDRLLEQTPEPMPKRPAAFPTFHGGGVLVDASRLKDLLHEVNDEAAPRATRDRKPRRRNR